MSTQPWGPQRSGRREQVWKYNLVTTLLLDGARVPVLRILQKLMFPVFHLRNRYCSPWCSGSGLGGSRKCLLVDLNVVVGLILDLHSSETLDNELLVLERCFGLVGTHVWRFCKPLMWRRCAELLMRNCWCGTVCKSELMMKRDRDGWARGWGWKRDSLCLSRRGVLLQWV